MIQKTGLAFILMLSLSMAALAAPKIYALKVDGLACPFCAFGIEKRLGKIAGVSRLRTDIKAGRVILTMKDGAVLDPATAKRAVKQAGFSLRGLEQIRPAAQAPAKAVDKKPSL